jgi:hypothetical protein
MLLPTRSSLKRLLSRGLLALALVFAQQQAALHWLSHAIEATQAKASKPTPLEHCDDCLTLGALGAGATSTSPVLPVSFAQHALTTPPPAIASPAALRLAFRSRAPPILS